MGLLDDQGRAQRNAVATQGTDYQPIILRRLGAILTDLHALKGLLGGLVSHQFQRTQQSDGRYLPHQWMIGKLRQTLGHIGPNGGGMVEQSIPNIDIQHLTGDCTSQGMAAVGVAVPKDPHFRRGSGNGIGNITADHSRRQGHIGRGQRLGTGHHFWLHVEFFSTKSGTETSEATDDLVVPEQDTVFVQNRLHRFKITCGGNDDATGTVDRFGDHRRDRLGTLGQNQLLQLCGATGDKICFTLPGLGTAIIVWRTRAQYT